MHALLIPIGSHGDVHPFVGIGMALRRRGHRVTIVTNGHFAPLVERAGLDFVELGTDEDFQRAINDPDLWHPMKGLRKVVEYAMLGAMRPVYEIIKARHVPGETVVAAQITAFGARLAQEKLGVPTVTVNLQPAVVRSVYATPVLRGSPLRPWMPRWLKRSLFRLMDAAMIDRLIAPGLNAYRAELGLPPVRRVMNGWWFSPQLVLGLYPDWFGPPQPDAPPNTKLTGFPLFDEDGVSEVSEDVSAFLDAGTPPIVFTPGSAMKHGADFFEAAVDSCSRLNRRGLLLTKYPEQVPSDLLATVRHFSYVPFSRLLPKASALVHHGGIGTMAQGLAVGIPQLVMPMAHDQHDNANRARRLGVGRSLDPEQFRGPAVARELSALLDTPEVAERCQALARRVREADPLNEACEAIEGVSRGANVSASAR